MCGEAWLVLVLAITGTVVAQWAGMPHNGQAQSWMIVAIFHVNNALHTSPYHLPTETQSVFTSSDEHLLNKTK